MNLQPATPKAPRILYLAAVDTSPSAQEVIATACRMANAASGAEIHIVHVLDPPALNGVDVAFSTMQMEQARSFVKELGVAAAAQTAVPLTTHIARGTSWREVLRIGQEIRADLVLVGTHDRSAVGRFFLGSVAQMIARKALCPVLVVRPKNYDVAPEIDPPCSDCLRTQNETQGVQIWCKRHAEKHPTAHLHYEAPESFAVGSMLIRP